MNAFDKAIRELSRIKLYLLDSNQLISYYYEKILCLYLQGAFHEVLSTIDEMYLNMTDSSQCISTLLLQTFTYNELHQWNIAKEKALQYANTLTSPEKDSLIMEINILYEKKNIPKLKNEKTSKILSFIPGFGHIYAGYWGEGMVSFLLNAGVLTFGVYEIFMGYYITGYLLGAGILSATYFGSSDRAAFLLKKHNYAISRSFNNHIKNEMLKY